VAWSPKARAKSKWSTKGLLELVEPLHDLAYGIEATVEHPLRINPQKTVIIVMTVTSARNPLT
jgi:hypothetical protein